jgi:hypothetical protein
MVRIRRFRTAPVRLALALAVATLLAGCGKPIMVHAVDGATGDALSEVRVYRHVFGFFRFFPGKKFVVTGPNGVAEVQVGPANTNLTMLRSGYEPVLFGVFERSVPAIAADEGGYGHVVLYRDIRGEPDNAFRVPFRAVRREPFTFEVVDAETKAPVAGVQGFGATFLYLPQPGVEADWGFPPLQRVTSGADGRIVLEQVSGFRNRFTLRLAGWQDVTVSVDGRDVAGPRSLDVQLRRLRTKHVDFLVVDQKTGSPIPGAEVVFGEVRDGLPPNPNGWTKVVGVDGRTGPMPVPDLEPSFLSVRSQNHKEWRGAPVWRALVDGQTKKLQMRRK